MSRLCALILGCSAASFVRAAPAPDTRIDAGIVEFEAAYEAWDTSRFGAAAELFREASLNAPEDPVNFYWLGTAQFHLMLQLQTAPANRTNKAAAEAASEAALAAHLTAVELDETQAESHAMLGTLYGMKIKGNLLRAVRYGPRVSKHQKLALKYGASDPRVQYLLGAGQFHTAKKRSEWGDALRTFQTAEKLFQAEATQAATAREPHWGYATCLTFIGRTFEKLGRPTEAAEYFREALGLHPQDSVAREGLKRVSEEN